MRWIGLIVRRLLGVVPTLIGVTLMSFGLLTLAPADRGASGPDARVQARSNFIDLPAFYNRAPHDLEADIDDVLFFLGNEEEHERLIHDVSERGAVLIPLVVGRLSSLAPDARNIGLRLLRPQLPMFLHDESPSSSEQEARAWFEIYEARRLDFRPAHVRRLLRRYVRDNDEEAVRELTTLGTFTLPDVIAELEGATDRTRVSLVALLEQVAPRAFPARLDASPSVRALAWQEWWFAERAHYIVWSSFDATFAHVRETRYGRWTERLLTLELGLSSYDGSPIAPRLWAGGAFTLSTVLVAILLAWLAAVPVGLIGALRYRQTTDRILGVLSFVLYAVPNVWIATLLAPRVTGSAPQASLGPVFTCVLMLFYPTFVYLSRQQRSAALAVLQSDFIRTARAKGVPEGALLRRHVLRLALVPVATLASLQLPLLLGGSIVLEAILRLPGLGRETLQAVAHRDIAWLVVVTAFAAVVSVLGVLAGDLLTLVDPRARRRAAVGGPA